MSLPQHQRLAEALLAQIADGTLAVGDRLPTEDELGDTYGVARGTVRRALGRIEHLGMITRRPRAGTTVIASSPVAAGYQPIARSANDITTLAAETRLVRPQTREVTVDAALAGRIGASAGTDWFVMEGLRAQRTRLETPLCWSEHYLRADLDREKLLRAQVTLDDFAGQQVEQTIAAALLEPRMAEALDAEPHGAALVVTRRHRVQRGKLVSVGIHTHPADRYSITTTVR